MNAASRARASWPGGTPRRQAHAVRILFVGLPREEASGRLVGWRGRGGIVVNGHAVARPMPAIGLRCHELRITDERREWRLVYRIDSDAIVVGKCVGQPWAATISCMRALWARSAASPSAKIAASVFCAQTSRTAGLGRAS